MKLLNVGRYIQICKRCRQLGMENKTPSVIYQQLEGASEGEAA